MDTRNDIREFLTSRRARLTPGQADLPDFGGRLRVSIVPSSSHGCHCSRGSAMSPFRVPWAFMPAMPGSPARGKPALCRQFPGLALAEALASRCMISRTAWSRVARSCVVQDYVWSGVVRASACLCVAAQLARTRSASSDGEPGAAV